MTKADIFLLGLPHAYQWLEGVSPSELELDQRHRFIERVRGILQSFRPNIIADETSDTDNPDLLRLLPFAPVPIDIPDDRKAERGRPAPPEHSLSMSVCLIRSVSDIGGIGCTSW